MCNEDAKIITRAITALLARREHSKAELLKKLTAKGYDQQLCFEQIRKFTQKDIQSDTRFAQTLVRSAYNKGKGPNYIKQQLMSHEVNDVDEESCIYHEDYDWFELAKKVRQKRFGEARANDFKEVQKQKRFLQYRGFEHQHIEHAIEPD